MSAIILLNNIIIHSDPLFTSNKKLIKMEHNDTLLCLEFQSIRNHVHIYDQNENAQYISKAKNIYSMK